MRSARRITPAESRVEAGVEVGREGPGATSIVAARIESIIKRRIEGRGRRGGPGQARGGGHVEGSRPPQARTQRRRPSSPRRGTCCRDCPLRPRPDGSDTVIRCLQLLARTAGSRATRASTLATARASCRRARRRRRSRRRLPHRGPCARPRTRTPRTSCPSCRSRPRSRSPASCPQRRRRTCHDSAVPSRAPPSTGDRSEDGYCRLFSRTARRAAEASASQVRASAVAGSERSLAPRWHAKPRAHR